MINGRGLTPENQIVINNEEPIAMVFNKITPKKYNKHVSKPTSLKNAPTPLVTRALRKKKEQDNERRERVNRHDMEILEQIHPSIITQPTIKKEKKNERSKRDEERLK